MRICTECFKAEDWKYHVDAFGQTAKCDVCGRDHTLTLDISDIANALSSIFGLYEANSEGLNLSTIIQRDFEIFQNEDVLNKVIKAFYRDVKRDVILSSPVCYKRKILKPINDWENLKIKLKNKFRFFSGEDVSQIWESYFEYNDEIPLNTFFYRGRLNENEKVEYKTVKDLGMPPKEKTPNGRANPHGIPCLYLTQEPETTMYELRSVFGDKITIGKFKTTQSLRIVNFDKTPLIYEAIEDDILESVVEGFLLKKHIGEELSKPMRRYDFKELEYVPTQFICEYVKRLDFDGISFSSAVHYGGRNLVLFGMDKIEFIDAEVKTVGELKMHFANNS